MPIGTMDTTSSRPTAAGQPGGARSLDAGLLLIGLGAIVLFISLFLEWYQPNAEAWDVFEVWDLVLAALAIAALAAVAGGLGFAPARPASWLIGASVASLVIVVYALIDPPPVADAIGQQGGGFGDPGTGLWLALAATILMTAGMLVSVARVSVAFSTGGPAAGDSLGRRSGAAVEPRGPAAPRPGAASEPGLGARAGGRFARRPPAAPDREPAEPGGVSPTEPTRRT
ncbi:MAG TPA: hypothetical protein VGO80_06915 [Solirubrobacteraceae bacterium]|jgi:hypothetical protein|nr:hypothetical protein [Solirubrobacteraceae bacterium]